MYDEMFLNKISSFGVLGYCVEDIVALSDPDNPEQLKKDLETIGSDAYKAYQKGKATGKYTLDKSLFDKASKNKDATANELFASRQHTDRINNTIREKFDI